MNVKYLNLAKDPNAPSHKSLGQKLALLELMKPERDDEWKEILSLMPHAIQEFVEQNNIGCRSIIINKYCPYGYFYSKMASGSKIIACRRIVETMVAIDSIPITGENTIYDVNDYLLMDIPIDVWLNHIAEFVVKRPTDEDRI